MMAELKCENPKESSLTADILQLSIAFKASFLLTILILFSTVAFAEAPLPAPETDPEALQMTEQGFLVVSDPSASVKVPGQVRFYDRSGNYLENRTLHADWFGEFGEIEDVRRYKGRWVVSASRLMGVERVTVMVDNFSQSVEPYFRPEENYLFTGPGHIVKSGNRTHLVAFDPGYSRDRIFYLRTERPIKDIPGDVSDYSENYNLTSENIYKDDIKVEGVGLSDKKWVIASSEEESVSLNFYNGSWAKVRTLELNLTGWNSTYEVNDLVVNGTEYWVLADQGQFGGEIFVADSSGNLVRSHKVGIYPNQTQIVQGNVREYERTGAQESSQGVQFLVILLVLTVILLLRLIFKDP